MNNVRYGNTLRFVKRYELLKDSYYVKYWEKTSYEYNEWDITACGKRIIEIEVIE